MQNEKLLFFGTDSPIWKVVAKVKENFKGKQNINLEWKHEILQICRKSRMCGEDIRMGVWPAGALSLWVLILSLLTQK